MKMLEFFKNSGFTVMPLENENKKKGIFGTLGSYAASAIRVPIGLTLGAVIGTVSFVRATIGTGANWVKAAVGVAGVVGSGIAQGVSFGCIRAVDGTRSILGLKPLKDRGFLSGMSNFHNACKEYTVSKWGAGKNSFYNVFTGEQDEKYKKSISNFFKKFKKLEVAQTGVNDERESVSTQRSTVVTNPLDLMSPSKENSSLHGGKSTDSSDDRQSFLEPSRRDSSVDSRYDGMSVEQISGLLYGGAKPKESRNSEDRTSFYGSDNISDRSVSDSRSISVDQRKGSLDSSVVQERESLLPQGAAKDKKTKYDSILSEFSNTGKALTASAQFLFGMRRSKRNEANKNRERH